MPGTSDSALDRMLHPKRVAVIGGSDKMTAGGRALRHLVGVPLDELWVVNPKHDVAQGVPSVASTDLLPDVLDLVVSAVPVSATAEAIRGLAGKDVGGIVVLSAGFSEVGPGGAREQDLMLAAAKQCGARVVGPNCSGIANVRDGIYGSMSTTLGPSLKTGPIAFVSQSGGLGASLFTASQREGLGSDFFITTGNEADLTTDEWIAHFAADPGIRQIAVNSEGIRRPESLVRAAELAAAAGKQIVYLNSGRSRAGSRAAKSHTASMVGAPAIADALMAQLGIVNVTTITEMFDALKMLRAPKVLAGNRVAVLTQSGGGGVLMADALEANGFAIPELTDAEQRRMSAVVKGYATVKNPVDVTGQMSSDPELFRAALQELGNCASVDALAIVLGPNRRISALVAQMLIDFAAGFTKPFCVTWLGGLEMETLTAAGIPAYDDPAAAARALRALPVSAPQEPPTVTEPAPAEADSAGVVLLEAEAKALLAGYGLPVTREVVAADWAEAAAGARELGYPVALKVLSTEMLHRAHVGGVALHLADETGLRRAFESMMDIAPAGARVVVQPMAAAGVELHVGAIRDPLFGIVVAVGLGGTLVEIVDEKRLLVAPVSEQAVRDALGGLFDGRLVHHARGLTEAHVSGVVDIVRQVVRLLEDHDEIVELECNPVIASGAAELTIVDSLINRSGAS